MYQKKILIGLICILSCFSCKHSDFNLKEKSESTLKPLSAILDLSVSFDEAFENTVYPSYLLAFASPQTKKSTNLNLIEYTFTSPKENSRLKIVLESSLINNETVLLQNFDSQGKKYTISPMINWNFETLKKLRQSGCVDLNFKCYLDDEEIVCKTLRLNYRPVNECIYHMKEGKHKNQDLAYMYGAYVNEDHPKIDMVLKEALKTGVVNSYFGYKQGEKEKENTLNQIFSIWYYLQLKGVKYSNITNTSNTSYKVYTQYIRLIDEVLDNDQANCADGSVFLCSILKKIDIKPIMVFVPGHMYIGYYTKENKSKLEFLETTLIGAVNFNEVDKNPHENLKKYVDNHFLKKDHYKAYITGEMDLETVKKEISMNSFKGAMQSNRREVQDNVLRFSNKYDNNYQILELSSVRYKVSPIPN